MSRSESEVESFNAIYASGFDKSDLPLPPARGVLLLTCMDARIDPAKFAGLAEGEAHGTREGPVIDLSGPYRPAGALVAVTGRQATPEDFDTAVSGDRPSGG
jgi:hypothetical protein